MLSIGPYKAPLVSWAHYATLLAAGPVLARAWSTSPKPDTATEQIHRSPGLPLGREAPPADAGEDRQLVAAGGAGLEGPVLGARVRGLGHGGDDQGLRDRLPAADRERVVGVGDAPVLGGYEFLPGQLGHDLEHPLVGGSVRPQLLGDHPLASLVGAHPPG